MTTPFSCAFLLDLRMKTLLSEWSIANGSSHINGACHYHCSRLPVSSFANARYLEDSGAALIADVSRFGSISVATYAFLLSSLCFSHATVESTHHISLFSSIANDPNALTLFAFFVSLSYLHAGCLSLYIISAASRIVNNALVSFWMKIIDHGTQKKRLTP